MSVTIMDSTRMPPEPLRMIVYGAPRVGKTYFASTFPRPLFLSAGLEGGEKTLADRPGVLVAPIKNSSDMRDVISQLQRNPSMCDTVVVDSGTFYVEMIINELVRKNKGGPLKFQDWGVIDIEIMRTLLPSLHQLPMHIVWVALEHAEKDEATGTVCRVVPMLGGQRAHKLSAVNDLIARLAIIPLMHADQVIRETRVLQVQPQMTPQGPILAGGRFNNAFPHPYIAPTWAALMECIGNRVLNRNPPGPHQAPAQRV